MDLFVSLSPISPSVTDRFLVLLPFKSIMSWASSPSSPKFSEADLAMSFPLGQHLYVTPVYISCNRSLYAAATNRAVWTCGPAHLCPEYTQDDIDGTHRTLRRA